MRTTIRDDAILKNKQMMRVLSIACISEALVILVLSALVVYLDLSRNIVLVPTNSNVQYKVSALHVSANYIKDMAENVVQLRLSWNAQSISHQFQKLLAMSEMSARQSLAKQLNQEIKVVKKRKMSSVFYQEGVPLANLNNMTVKVVGTLQRVDDDVLLSPVKKAYLIHFKDGIEGFRIVSIKEGKLDV